MKVSVNGREFEVEIAPGQVRVDGKPFKVDLKETSGGCTAVHVDGMPYKVEVRERKGPQVAVAVGDKTYSVLWDAPAPAAGSPSPSAAPVAATTPAAQPRVEARVEPKKEETKVEISQEPPVCDMPYLDGVTAVMPGRILSVKVQEGQVVKMGAVLCVLEAMKMENEIRAPRDGVVANLKVKEGSIVNGGDLLMMVC
ncbi:MAG: biotin/lipoyl-containing protein [Dehalococcoidia bacterium]|nr:biotin/lipoyl-containing protein [Dehalococcoidia bacterium]